MEALRKLEETQAMLSFMSAQGLSSHHAPSDRFLADLLRFLPCWELNMQERLHLISEFLLKISAEFLDEACSLVIKDEWLQRCTELPLVTCPKQKVDMHPSVSDIPMVGLDAMQRANSTLEDFCKSYFMFHGMDANEPKAIFKYLPILFFTESYIYQLDTFNEKELYLSQNNEISTKVGCQHWDHVNDLVMHRNTGNSARESSRSDPFQPIVNLLQGEGLFTERIRTELQAGVEYWALERKLCHALTSKKKILIEDVMRAIHLKSFDYRVLNLLLYQLHGQEVNELHMEFLSVSELLVEISDDLYDYEDDVMENSFNILRMFVRIYGPSAAPTTLAECIAEAEKKYEALASKLDAELSLRYWRRCEEATREGGSTSGHALGTWSIPPVIVDEDSFRLLNTDKTA